jgi:type I restriction enzyme M protein
VNFTALQANYKHSKVKLPFDQVKTANRDVFDVHERITARDQDVAVVTALLQEYSILEADYDVIGTAYETYVASHLRGKRGQFFTPRIVVRLMVRMVGPHEGDIILDLACGSGGFLIECLTQLRNKIEHSRRSKIAKQEAKSQIRNNLFGAEISPRLVKVAQANMLLGKDGHSNIVQGDSLRPPFEQLPKEFLSRCNPGVPTVVLTNPPFGAGAYHRITNKEILSTFLSGSAWEQDEDTGEISFPKDKVGSGAPPEILFLERCIQWSASGGKIGIVMARGQLDNKEAKGIRHIVLQECRITAIVNCHEDTFEPFVGSKASLLILEKKSKHEARDYRIFMAISKKCGQTSRGEPLFKRTQDGKPVLINGQPVLDHDMDEILEAFYNFQTGRKIKHPYCFSVRRSQIDASTLSLNPVQYLPHFEESRRKVIQLGESEEWEVRSLGDIADAVFNGPRFVRTGMHADEGITSGPSIVPYYTGTAMTQSKSENVKYFDIHKANKQQKKHLRKLRIFEGWILITDSRTLGRIIMARKRHHGAIATNNLIRVVINDQLLRGYVYEFLQSPYGQHQMLRNEYGTNQSHLEPEHVQNLLVPIPKDRKKLEEISKAALESVDYMERSMFLSMQAKKGLTNMIDGNKQIEEESEAQQGNLSLYPLDPKEALGVFMKVDPEKVKQREKEEKRRKKK